MTTITDTREMVDGGHVVRMFGLTRRTIDRKVIQRVFPAPVKFGRSLRWYLDELVEYQRTLKRKPIPRPAAPRRRKSGVRPSIKARKRR